MEIEPSSSFSLNFNTPMNSGFRFVLRAPLGLPIGYISQVFFLLFSTIIDKIPDIYFKYYILNYIFNSLKRLRQKEMNFRKISKKELNLKMEVKIKN